MLALIFAVAFYAFGAEIPEEDWQTLRPKLDAMKCSDTPQFQKYLEYFAVHGAYHQITTRAEDCRKEWTSAQNDCFNNMNAYMDGRDKFGDAGRTMEDEIGEERFRDMMDLSHLFRCKKIPDAVTDVKDCEFPPDWPEKFLDCIRKKSKVGECKKVDGWCAVKMKRNHEGIIDKEDSIVFFDPKRNRFFLNFSAPGVPRHQILDNFVVIPPKNNSEPWKTVFATTHFGMQMAPNNHSQGEGCWHCHPGGAPRKMEPLWGSVSAFDKPGLDCINGAIEKMGTFTAEHLWKGAKLGPARGEGSSGQSCNDCHSGDISQNHSYPQRGMLFHNSQMTREMFTKMTSWVGTMPPGANAKIPGYDQYREILGRVYKLPEAKREEVLNEYIRKYEEHAGGSVRLEFPDKNIKRAGELLEARRLAMADALRKMGASGKEIALATRVASEIDQRGLKAFADITQTDRERLRLWLGGGRANCLTTPPPVSGDSSTTR